MHAAAGSSERQRQLAWRMKQLNVREEDLEESFVRSQGSGGQNVNKVSTCVVLFHPPTGLQVKCQVARTQATNRLLARERLLDKLEAQRQGRREEQQARREKLRRQKRGRSRAAKERILADKARHSRKKADRRQVQSN